MFGRRGAQHRRRLVLAEIVVAAVDVPLVGLAIALAASALWVLFAIYLIGVGLNYVPLALYAVSLARAGQHDTELVGVDVGAELRRYTARQAFLLLRARRDSNPQPSDP
jgi:hypothetical protein